MSVYEKSKTTIGMWKLSMSGLDSKGVFLFFNYRMTLECGKNAVVSALLVGVDQTVRRTGMVVRSTLVKQVRKYYFEFLLSQK